MGEAPPRPEDMDPERRWRAIVEKLDAASGSLARQGSVAARSTPGGLRVYSVRYMAEEGGRRRQRAIYLGSDGVLIRRARALIGQYRERERQAREVELAARFVAASAAILRRMASMSHRRPARPGGA